MGLHTSTVGDRNKRTRGRAWMKVIAAVKKRDKVCVACKAQGKITEINEIDHILPLHKGGTDAMDNLQGLCLDCHLEKTTGKVAIGLDGWPLR